DMDAVPKPWKHWHLFNIPPDITRIEEGTIPLGATEGLSNNHTFGYEGPCPRYFSGTHHYRLRLYALDGCLDLPAVIESEQMQEDLQEHILALAELVGIYTAPIPHMQSSRQSKHNRVSPKATCHTKLPLRKKFALPGKLNANVN